MSACVFKEVFIHIVQCASFQQLGSGSAQRLPLNPHLSSPPVASSRWCSGHRFLTQGKVQKEFNEKTRQAALIR